MPGEFRAWAFQREPMDVLSPHDPTEFAVYVCSTQVFKTTAYENTVGCFTQNDPCPILVYQPRDADVEYFSKSAIDPMFRESPSLHGLVAEKKSRDSSNTITEKHFIGGSLTMLGANSSANFRMRSARVVLMDEVDAWVREFPGEGSPVSNAIARTDNFRGNRKICLASSPTVKGASVIEEWWDASDQRRYFMPCPFCGHKQILVWRAEYSPWPTGGGVVWGEHGGINIEPENAHYKCESCSGLIPNYKKLAMINGGEWRKGKPESAIAGFHLSRLNSPITPWGDLAVEFLRVQRDPVRLQSFVNTKLAEWWTPKGEAPEWRQIVDRRDPTYSAGTVPMGGLLLTAAVDVQRADGGRLEIEILAHGDNRETWSIDYRILHGDPAQPEVWDRLEKILYEMFPHESGGSMGIERMFVDSGDGSTTSAVYRWVQKQPRARVFAVKGDNRSDQPVSRPKAVELKKSGKVDKFGAILRTINVDFFKGTLYSDLTKRAPTAQELATGQAYPQGYCHFPLDTTYGDEYFKQLCAEQLVTKRDRTGRAKTEYQLIRPRNEALDARVYNMAAGWDCNVHRMKTSDWARLKQKIEASAPKLASGVPDAPKRFTAPRPIVTNDGWV